MNFKEAYKKLQKIANGEDNDIRYSVFTYEDGEAVQLCALYIAGYPYITGDTWEQAFDLLEAEINGRNVVVESIEEIQPGGKV